MAPVNTNVAPIRSVDEVAGSYVGNYDADGDGAVTVDPMAGQTEYVREEPGARYEAPTMFRAADNFGNQDGRADMAEVARIVAGYDNGQQPAMTEVPQDSVAGDGQLQATEQSMLAQDFGEEPPAPPTGAPPSSGPDPSLAEPPPLGQDAWMTTPPPGVTPVDGPPPVPPGIPMGPPPVPPTMPTTSAPLGGPGATDATAVCH